MQFVAAVGIYVILTVLHRMDARVHRRTKLLEVYVELENAVTLGDFIRGIRGLELEIADIQYEPDGVLENGSRAFVASIKSKKPQEHYLICEKIKKITGVMHVEVL